MAVAAFRKIWDFLVGENEEELEDDEILDNAYDVNEEDEDIDSGSERKVGFWNRRTNNVVQMPQAQPIRMKIIKPTNYDPDVNEIISELKAKNGIVMNLEYVNKDIRWKNRKGF